MMKGEVSCVAIYHIKKDCCGMQSTVQISSLIKRYYVFHPDKLADMLVRNTRIAQKTREAVHLLQNTVSKNVWNSCIYRV